MRITMMDVLIFIVIVALFTLLTIGIVNYIIIDKKEKTSTSINYTIEMDLKSMSSSSMEEKQFKIDSIEGEEDLKHTQNKNLLNYNENRDINIESEAED